MPFNEAKSENNCYKFNSYIYKTQFHLFGKIQNTIYNLYLTYVGKTG